MAQAKQLSVESFNDKDRHLYALEAMALGVINGMYTEGIFVGTKGVRPPLPVLGTRGLWGLVEEVQPYTPGADDNHTLWLKGHRQDREADDGQDEDDDEDDSNVGSGEALPDGGIHDEV